MNDLNAKDTATKIRAELRSRTAKQVSVRSQIYSMGHSVSVSIKTADIPLPLVEAVTGAYHSSSRYSLSVFASYEFDAVAQLAESFAGLIVPGFKFGPLEVIDKRSGGWMAIVNTETGKHHQDAYPDSSAATTFARALACTGALSGYADQVAELIAAK